MAMIVGGIALLEHIYSPKPNNPPARTVTVPIEPRATYSASDCAAQHILDACLNIEQPLVKACVGNDWDCLCNSQTNLVTCYNNCPNDPDAFPAQQQELVWCNAASIYGSSALSKQAATATSTSSASVTASSTISTAVQTGAPLSSLSGDAVVTPTRAADIVAITAAGAAAANSGDEKSRKTSDGAVKEGKVSVGKLLAGLVLFGALFA